MISGPTITILIHFIRIYYRLSKYIQFVIFDSVISETSSNENGHIFREIKMSVQVDFIRLLKIKICFVITGPTTMVQVRWYKCVFQKKSRIFFYFFFSTVFQKQQKKNLIFFSPPFFKNGGEKKRIFFLPFTLAPS